MKHKKAFLYVRPLLASLSLALLMGMAAAPAVSADQQVPCPDGTKVLKSLDESVAEACKGHMQNQDNSKKTNTGDATNSIDPQADPAANCQKNDCDLIKKYLNPAINLLSALVGLAVALSIVQGGIQYSTSGGDPQKAAKAKQRITNAVIALVAFTFLFAFIQWLVPGGVLHR